MKQITLILIGLLIISSIKPLDASEVFEETGTQVVVREHPKTGKPYVSIVPAGDILPKDPFGASHTKVSRPDYRLLDPKVKSGEVPYDGPYSSSTKIYVFAATIATLGVAGGVIGMAVAPAAASAGGAASGGGAFLAGGAAVAGGTAALAAKADSAPDNFIQKSQSRSAERAGDAG